MSEKNKSIRESLDTIRYGVKGEDIQGALADGLELAYEHASVDKGNANMEVQLARGNNITLNDRLNTLDKKGGEIDKSITNSEKELQRLANVKLNKGEKIQLNQIDKNSGKIDETYLSEELIGQIAGEAPVGSLPAKDSLVTDMYASDSVSIDKLTSDVKSAIVSDTMSLSSASLWEQGLALTNGGVGDWKEDLYHSSRRIRIKNLIPTFGRDYYIYFNDDIFRLHYYNYDGKTDENFTYSNSAVSPFLSEPISKDEHLGLFLIRKDEKPFTPSEAGEADIRLVPKVNMESLKKEMDITEKETEKELHLLARNSLKDLKNPVYWEEKTGNYTAGGDWYEAKTPNYELRAITKHLTEIRANQKIKLHFDDSIYRIRLTEFKNSHGGRINNGFTLTSPLEYSPEKTRLIGLEVGRKDEGILSLPKFLQEFEIEYIDEFNSTNSGNGTQISEKFISEIKDLTNEINLSNTAYDFRMAFITDTHQAGEEDASNKNRNELHLRNVAEASKNIDFDIAIHGGDLIHDYTERKYALENIYMNIREFRNAMCPTFFVQGNHDTNDAYAFGQTNDNAKANVSDLLTQQQWDNMASFEKTNVVYGDKSKSYYYTDFPEKEIRIITLNTHDCFVLNEGGTAKYNRGYPAFAGIRQDQLVWLGEKALDFTDKDDWHVIIISHALLESSHPDYRTVRNSQRVVDLIKARKDNATYKESNTDISYPDFNIDIDFDYTNSEKVNIVCFVNGHLHWDLNFEENGMRFISVISSHDTDVNSLTHLDTNDSAWDVFNINKTNRKVDIIRFGNRGTNRSFSY